jgi:hypothetical protein
MKEVVARGRYAVRRGRNRRPLALRITALRLYLEDLIAERAAVRAEKVKESDFYNRTYPLQIAASAKLQGRWTIDDVLMRFCSAYGWMPRGIQEWNLVAVPALVELLNQAEPDGNEIINAASRCINNSIVGGSKFLHFYNPTCFPIFDSVIESLWWDKKRTTVDRYAIYWEGVVMVSDSASKAAQGWASHWMGYDVSAVRAIEALAFYTQRTRRKGSPPLSVTQHDEDEA